MRIGVCVAVPADAQSATVEALELDSEESQDRSEDSSAPHGNPEIESLPTRIHYALV